MNCQEAQAHIQAWLDGDLSAAGLANARAHIDTCANCRAELADYSAMQSALRELPAPAPPPDLTERLWAAQPRRRSHWPTLAVAASFVAALVILPITFWNMDNRVQGHHAAEVQLPLNRSKPIELALSAPRDLQQVRLTLTLPEHVELKGFPSQRTISWKTDLRAGSNRLSLPVKANMAGSGELVARIEHGGKSREMRVQVISKQSSSGYTEPAADSSSERMT